MPLLFSIVVAAWLAQRSASRSAISRAPTAAPYQNTKLRFTLSSLSTGASLEHQLEACSRKRVLPVILALSHHSPAQNPPIQEPRLENVQRSAEATRNKGKSVPQHSVISSILRHMVSMAARRIDSARMMPSLMTAGAFCTEECKA